MEYLQYLTEQARIGTILRLRFKPCYKWNTFNTESKERQGSCNSSCFKPCYKWNTFNTGQDKEKLVKKLKVLNLVINGIPSIQNVEITRISNVTVLNLVINGIPSIQSFWLTSLKVLNSFKPCYKWNTFNTVIKGGIL